MCLVIRPIQVSDASAIHRIFSQSAVMPYILSLPSIRIDQVEERIRTSSKDRHEFVAELDGTVVGSASLTQMTGRKSHIASFGTAVDSDYHCKGIGTALLTKILDLADNWLILERVEFSVLATNPRAQAMYERFGFVVEGRKIKAVRSEGHYVDEILMSRFRPSLSSS